MATTTYYSTFLYGTKSSNCNVAWRCGIFSRFDARVDNFAGFDAAGLDDAARSDMSSLSLRSADDSSLPFSLP